MNDNHDDISVHSETPNPIPENSLSNSSDRQPVQKKFGVKQATVMAVVFLVGMTAGAAGMYFYKGIDSNETNKSTRQTDQVTSGEEEPELTKADDKAPQEPSLTDNWQSYTDPDSKYSFRYANTWTLKREVRRNPYNQNDSTEYEQTTLMKGDKIIVMLDYPFEMIGCGSPIDTLPYEFGEHTVTMTDPCGGVSGMAGKQYMVLFENPKTKPSNLTDNEWPILRLSYYTDTDNEQTFSEFKEFAKSIKGLTPAESN